jgi:NADH dehydrogenase FAD-containing subunit
MLTSSSVGTIEFKSIVESIRDANPSVSFLEGKVIDIELEPKRARIIMGGEHQVQEEDDTKSLETSIVEIPFDTVIYGVGVGPLSSGAVARTPGLSSNNVFFLKSVLDAKKLRSGVIDLLEKASRPNLSEEERRRLLTFVIVGGTFPKVHL